jgi:hypothetical protein
MRYCNIKFHKIPSNVGSDMFHEDGQADMTKLLVGFSQSGERA